MEDKKDYNDRYLEVIRAGQEANETVRTFSKQVMEKAQRNYGKIETLKKMALESHNACP